VTLCFTVVPGRDTQQQDIEPFQVFFAAFSDVMHFRDVVAKLFLENFLDHFGNVFGIASVAAKENAYSSHIAYNLYIQVIALLDAGTAAADAD
ncbi:hypothetical protein ACT9UI_19170, partial [Acinetobacter baumannii]|uniref:hypothetical protein n=1 Tax=Acinetobacter baumannii TaxID=470 RepID=UPI004039A382